MCLLFVVWKTQVSSSNQYSQQMRTQPPVTLNDAAALLKLKQFWFFAIYMIGVGAVYETYDQQFAIYYTHFLKTKRVVRKFWLFNHRADFPGCRGNVLRPWFVNKIGPKCVTLLWAYYEFSHYRFRMGRWASIH